MTQKYQEINAESIKLVMDKFYYRVRLNDELGGIFNPIIGNDNESWERHKERIAGFWRMVLLGEIGFDGFPLKRHLELAPFPREYFEIWLNLFLQSLREVYESEECIATYFAAANNIAKRFQQVMYK